MKPASTPEPGVALLLPGRRYGVERPVLYYVAEALRDLGWQTVAVVWDNDDASDEAVLSRGSEALQSLPPGRAMVVGKSLGSLLALEVAELHLPAIWLTPVLTEPRVREGIRIHTARALLVGGTADSMWDSVLAHASGHSLLELVGGDHRLQVPGDAISSAQFLVTLAEHARTFVGTAFSPA
ncbi:MAG: hypothetical protein ACYC3W_02200 [Candidatus Nanopelagicales bacterium]